MWTLDIEACGECSHVPRKKGERLRAPAHKGFSTLQRDIQPCARDFIRAIMVEANGA